MGLKSWLLRLTLSNEKDMCKHVSRKILQKHYSNLKRLRFLNAYDLLLKFFKL